MIKKIAFIGYPNKDHVEAGHFFEQILGLERKGAAHEGWNEFVTPEGKTIALDGYGPAGDPIYMAFEVDGIEAELERLRGHGVEIVKDVWDNKVCKMALFKGPGGHLLMLHELAPERKPK